MSIFLGGAALSMAAILLAPARANTPDSSKFANAWVPRPIPGAAERALMDGQVGPMGAPSDEGRDWGRDPFSLPEAIDPDSSSLILDERLQVLPELTGISILGGDHRAIIDGEIVGAGDSLASGFVVLQVSEDAVLLEKDDQRIALNFNSQQP